MAKTITIGRSPQSSIVVDPSYETVSNNHAEITLQDDGRVRFTDHSSNGTVINGTGVSNRSVYVTGDDVICLAATYTVDWEQVCSLIPELAMAEAKRTQRRGQAQQPAQDDGATRVMAPGQTARALNQTARADASAPQAPATTPAPAKPKKSKDKSKSKIAKSRSEGAAKPFYRSNLAMVIVAFIAVMVIIAFTVFDDVVKNIM